MQVYRSAVASVSAVLALASLVLVQAQQPQPQTPAIPMPPPTVPVVAAPRMPMAPPAVMGASVTPALEGWFKNADGTTTILIGYMNRNQSQKFDIPIGPNNKIEPNGANGPDYGQPTHFLLGRNYGVFTITVPRDFGTKRLTYTITANGQPQSITLGIPGGYQVEPFFRNDNGNTPPIAKLEPTGPEMKGPPRGIAQTLTGTVGQPVTLTVYATDTANTVDQMNQFGPRPAPSTARGDAGADPAAGGAAADPAAGGAGRGGRGGAGAGRGGGGRGAGRGGPPDPAVGAPADAAAGGAAAGGAAASGAAARGAGAGAGGRGAGAGALAGRGGGGGGRGGPQVPIRLTWSKYRGPGEVTFSNAEPEVAADAETVKMFAKPGDFTGKATTTATFSEPGEYVVRGQLNDSAGNGGGDQCCWSNVHVKVNVRAAAGAK